MKQGGIFVSSWGYDQTNVDFYKVVKVTAKTVMLIPIERKVQLKGFMRYTAMPIPGSGRERRSGDGLLIVSMFRRVASPATQLRDCGMERHGKAFAMDGNCENALI